MALTIEGATTAEYDGTRSPAFTFSVSPIEGDVIVAMIGAVSNAAFTGGVDPTDWTNAIGASGTVVNVGAVSAMAVIYHVVTAAEDAADTVTWTLSLMWAGGETGNTGAVYIRGVDPAAVVDAFGIVNGTPAATPHSLAAVAGVDVTTTGGMVLRGVAKDAAGNYASAPAGHATRTSATGGTTHNGIWIGTRDVDSTASTNIDAVDITPQNSDEYGSFTLVITPAATGPSTGAATGAIGWAGSATGTTVRNGSTSGAITWAGTATGASAHYGAATGMVTWAGAATGAQEGSAGASHPLRSTITPRRELRPHIYWG